jgi:RES domain-containing protein
MHARGLVKRDLAESMKPLSLLDRARWRYVVPPDLMSVQIYIPDDIGISIMKVRRLPVRWRHHPSPRRLQLLGDRWLDARKTAILQVPSAVIPGERNYLLNPSHPDARRIRVIGAARFAFDSRLI